jgi:hypothetical protein
MDEKGRSLKADRRTKAKKTTKSGYGDQATGDERRNRLPMVADRLHVVSCPWEPQWCRRGFGRRVV